MHLTIYTDGGSRSNPGPAACAFVVINNDQIIYQHNQFLGTQTNNYAEYQGIIYAIQFLSNQDTVNSVTFKLDSLLVVNQLKGLYKVKEPSLISLHSQAKLLLQELRHRNIIFEIIHVPRSQNSQADFLVNQCLDQTCT